MKGTLLNATAVLVGSGIGLLFRRGIGQGYQRTVVQGLALATMVIGLQMAMKTANVLIVIISLAIGGVLGEALKIEEGLNKLEVWLTAKFGSAYGNAGHGFITASLIYCVGAMAIVGAIQDGLQGDASTLYAKAVLDGIMAVVLAATMGVGVALSSVSIFVYQGAITILAGALNAVLSEAVIRELTAVGGILIIGIGIIILDLTKIKIANLLPAIPAAAVITLLWPK